MTVLADPNGLVNAVVLQPDGKILIGGSFESISFPAVTRNGIPHFNADGTLDTTFDPNATGGIVTAIALQTDGKILIGGSFTTLSPNGGAAVTRNRIARLNADGTLDTAFDPNASSTVTSIVVQADGKIIVGGTFNGANSISGQTRNRIARLDGTTGSADLSFDPNANSLVRTIALQPDGKILVGGGFNGTNSIGGQTHNRIARLDPRPALRIRSTRTRTARPMHSRYRRMARSWLAALSAGTNSIGGQTRDYLARLDATGSVDLTFNPNPNGFGVYSLAVQADGKILVGGDFGSIGGQTRPHCPARSHHRFGGFVKYKRHRSVLSFGQCTRTAAGRQDFDGRQF